MQPLLVIARGEIRCRVHLLDIVAGATGNRDWRGDLHGEDTPFPVVVKHGFVLLPHDGTEPVHPSHVVNTVHATSPVCSSPVPSGATASAQGEARSPRLRRRRGHSLTCPLPVGRGGEGG